MAKAGQSFQLGLFGKGLMTGLVFGIILSALLAWMIGSRGGTRDVTKPNVDCKAWASVCGNTSNNEAPRQFDFYNRKNEAKEPAPPINNPSAVHPPATASLMPSMNAPSAKENVILATKFYTKLSEVEAIKAELALLGMEPKLIVNKGQFQLQLGPYPNAAQAEKARNDLGGQASAFTVQ